jgi:hypothetical protein
MIIALFLGVLEIIYFYIILVALLVFHLLFVFVQEIVSVLILRFHLLSLGKGMMARQGGFE